MSVACSAGVGRGRGKRCSGHEGNMAPSKWGIGWMDPRLAARDDSSMSLTCPLRAAGASAKRPKMPRTIMLRHRSSLGPDSCAGRVVCKSGTMFGSSAEERASKRGDEGPGSELGRRCRGTRGKPLMVMDAEWCMMVGVSGS